MLPEKTQHKIYLSRCFDLARLGTGKVSPNPLVGAVLVHENRIIGEGWHSEYGGAHAEVNALRSVAAADRQLVAAATLYVSLEPCCIYGRTPPCTNLIIENNIPRVVISCLDQTPGVAGRGVEILRAAGVEVTVGILEQAGKALSRVRNTFVTAERPYISLKWAQSADGFIGKSEEQIWLTQPLTKRLVHKWRSETAAILVGTNTALTDDPALTNRYYFGESPLRIVLDRTARLPLNRQLFNGNQPTWVVSEQSRPADLPPQVEWQQLKFDNQLLTQLLKLLVAAQRSSLIVEGGSQLLQSFIDQDLWDEARIFSVEKRLHSGVAAPTWRGHLVQKVAIGRDQLRVYQRTESVE